MAITHGMNPAEVRNQAKQLDNQASAIGDVITKIDSILGTLGQHWKGNDYTQFKGWWDSQHKKNLADLRTKINGLATSARNNAGRQEEISNQA